MSIEELVNASSFSRIILHACIATSQVVLRWMCDSPRTGCVWRTTRYIYVARTSNNRVIMACETDCCLLPQCEALCTCRSGFPIATHVAVASCWWSLAELFFSVYKQAIRLINRSVNYSQIICKDKAKSD